MALVRYTRGPFFALLFCPSAGCLKSDGRGRAEAKRGLENKVGRCEGEGKHGAGRRLNVLAAIKLIAVADTVIDTRLSFAANIVGACRRIFYSVSIENKPRQLHLIPRTSAPEEVINYHIGNIDSFINPTLMALESKKCCVGFFLDTFSY